MCWTYAMTLTTLAVIMLVGLAGPVLALLPRWNVPVVIGELFAGLLLGPTAFNFLDASEPTFTFLAEVGFGLIMFVAGSHIPVRRVDIRPALRAGLRQSVIVGLLAIVLGVVVASLFHTHHPALYAVLITSSSAALVLPTTQALHIDGVVELRMLAQVAIADTACIVALPLVIDPRHATRAVIGTVALILAALTLYLLLRAYDRSGLKDHLHEISKTRRFALELRLNLVILFALAALAVRMHVSILLAGFLFGMVLAAIGEPRRLARQLFALSEGFLGPLFFVWLGASINLGELRAHPSYIALGIALGLTAVLAHIALRLVGQPLALGALAAAQIGIPAAAATVGSELGVLRNGEAAALLLGALVTIAVATAGAAVSGRRAANVENVS